MPQLEIQLIAVITAVACAIPGAFLVLRRVSMLSDAISHAILPGIVVAFFILRTMRLSDLPDVLSRAALTSAVVLLLVGAAMAFKTVVSLSYAPQILAEFILSLSENPLILLFLINLLLFIVGIEHASEGEQRFVGITVEHVVDAGATAHETVAVGITAV